MTSHLGLDDLTYLVASDGARPAGSHLAGCELCRTRLANLRSRSADVSAALGGIDADIDPMPADVMLRITAALAAARVAPPSLAGADVAQPAIARRADARPAVAPPADTRAADRRSDDLAIARERRGRRLRGLLTAAAAVVVIAGGFGAFTHYAGGQSAATSGQSSAAAGSSDASGTGSGSGGETLTQSGATPNPAAARGVLLEDSFTDDANAFVAAQRELKTPKPLTQPLTGTGSSRCATVARETGSSTAGYQAGGGNAAPAALIGAVTLDGRAGVLYLVSVGPAQVAVVLSGCSTPSPTLLASATL